MGGKCGLIKEIEFGTTNQRMLQVEELNAGSTESKSVTILVRGSSKMVVDEAKRSIHDALCVIRNLIKDNKIIVGGGASELACAIHLKQKADEIPGIEQYAIRHFAQALAECKAKQISEESHKFGVDCIGAKISNMEDLNVFETLLSKKQQFQLATQVVKMILKIDDVIEKDEMAEMMAQQGM